MSKGWKSVADVSPIFKAEKVTVTVMSPFLKSTGDNTELRARRMNFFNLNPVN